MIDSVLGLVFEVVIALLVVGVATPICIAIVGALKWLTEAMVDIFWN